MHSSSFFHPEHKFIFSWWPESSPCIIVMILFSLGILLGPYRAICPALNNPRLVSLELLHLFLGDLPPHPALLSPFLSLLSSMYTVSSTNPFPCSFPFQLPVYWLMKTKWTLKVASKSKPLAQNPLSEVSCEQRVWAVILRPSRSIKLLSCLFAELSWF